MGGVVYTKLPPVMAAIKDGDIKALSALPDAGRQPGFFGSWGSAYACG